MAKSTTVWGRAMTTKDKPMTPAFVSYSALTSFFNQLREHEHVPTRIDRTLMPKASGSQISALLAALKFFQFIDEAGKPSEDFKKVVLATDDERKPLIAQILKSRYDFLFGDQHFDLEKATSGEMAEKFRSLAITGSTVTKTISFFLAAAKDANIKVSPHIKAPPAPKPNGSARKSAAKRKDEVTSPDVGDDEEEEVEDEGVERFEIPIPGKTSVKVIVPSDLDADDWEMLQSMITVYIKRWKGFKS
jgi:hypothetical protein